MHGAFRSGVIKTKWGIDSVLKAPHNLFDESPAKREDYIKVTGSEMFALPFCGHRGIEDKKVAERALQIWPHIITSKSQIPTSSSFSTWKLAVQDKLISVKLEFFCFSCSSAEALFGDFSVRWPTATIYHFRTPQVMLETDGEICEDTGT